MTNMMDYTKKRGKITQLLNKVSAKVTEELERTGLSMPIFLIVPSTGSAFLTFGTPDDPSDEEWDVVGEIVTRVIAGYMDDDIKLVANKLTCAAAGSAKHSDGRASSAI